MTKVSLKVVGIYVKDSGVPVLGVNSGHLGFLANVPVEEIEDAVDFIAAGKYEVEQRDMLQLCLLYTSDAADN